jgi:hypothetical protein
MSDAEILSVPKRVRELGRERRKAKKQIEDAGVDESLDEETERGRATAHVFSVLRKKRRRKPFHPASTSRTLRAS